MAKLVKCKSCGAEIAKIAKVCPHCGAKQKKPVVLGVVFVIIGIVLLVAVFGEISDEPHSADNTEKPSQEQNEPSSEPTKEPEKSVFGVGERAKLNDVIVTLVSVNEGHGANFMAPPDGKVFLICEFEIENNSSKDITVSSLLSFEAYVDDYSTSMSLTATTSSDKSQLDGAVAAGKKMSGVIGYEASEDWSVIEVRFKPDFWTGKEITFEFNK